MSDAFHALRRFPADALILCLIALAVLSWTSQVALFRLGIPSLYEHVIAYCILGLVILASRGTTQISVGEMILLATLAALLEAAKAEIPFRHPKLSDFFADLVGLGFSFTTGYLIRLMIHNLRRALRVLYQIDYWRP